MNKTELIKKVAAENDLSQKAAAGVVDSVLNSIMDSLAARKPVTLIGFGTFSLREEASRCPRGPQPRHRQDHEVCRQQHPGLQGRQSLQGQGQLILPAHPCEAAGIGCLTFCFGGMPHEKEKSQKSHPRAL